MKSMQIFCFLSYQAVEVLTSLKMTLEGSAGERSIELDSQAWCGAASVDEVRGEESLLIEIRCFGGQGSEVQGVG